MKITALLVLVIAGCWAQGIGGSAPKFPSDNEAPGKAGAFLMLNAVCPGRAATALSRWDVPVFGCNCPGSVVGLLPVTSVVRGHFLSPTSEDAILSTVSCNWNVATTYLVSRRGGKWIQVREEPQDTSMCHKVRLEDGRDVLVCLEVHGNHLEIINQITYHDYKTLNDYDLYEVSDSSQNCGLPPGAYDTNGLLVYSGQVSIERIFVSGAEFTTREGRPAGSAILVDRGTIVVEAGVCPDDIPTQPTRVEFRWTGTTYERVGPVDK